MFSFKYVSPASFEDKNCIQLALYIGSIDHLLDLILIFINMLEPFHMTLPKGEFFV